MKSLGTLNDDAAEALRSSKSLNSLSALIVDTADTTEIKIVQKQKPLNKIQQ